MQAVSPDRAILPGGPKLKKFAYSRPVLAAIALVALAVELGAGHKFG
jgi:hypothetical protein